MERRSPSNSNFYVGRGKAGLNLEEREEKTDSTDDRVHLQQGTEDELCLPFKDPLHLSLKNITILFFIVIVK